MSGRLQNIPFLKKITKSPWYARMRRYFPMEEQHYYADDMERLASAEIVKIDWPAGVKKPLFAVIKDYEMYPRWTKYVRFLENNNFDYEIFELNTRDWLERARKFDIFVGILSNDLCHLQQMREKFLTLEAYLGKTCFPSTRHILLYEDKTLEAYISEACGIPFARTHISNDEKDALALVETLPYPVVHKIDPGSGSLGVELVQDKARARKIVRQAFSAFGRATHSVYYKQKNYVYFQEFVPNDGHDIRVIITGNWAFGYRRKVLQGDFRASGMNMVVRGELPAEAVWIAWKANQVIQAPMLVVDMVHGLDGQFKIIEFSPICQMEKPAQLTVDGKPGAYILDNGSMRFIEGKYWVHELSLREFLLKDYLPKVQAEPEVPLSQD